MCTRRTRGPRCRGAVAVVVVTAVPVVIGMAALTVDVGYMYNIRAALQRAADAAALAVAIEITDGYDPIALQALAGQYANTNHPGHGNILTGFTLGNWDRDAGVFVSGGDPVNGVRVVVQRSQAAGNPVDLFFAGIFGITQTEISATATAAGPGVTPLGVRFLIDDEMFDTDVPVIQDFAASLGVSSDDLLTDADGDGFIDMPPTVLELPTGQVGDEALFDIGLGFPYTSTSVPSLADFLLFEEGGNQHGIATSDLDPLVGVEPLSDETRYPDFVNSYQVHVSPLYKSDVSDRIPGVNALGVRRGLVAFRILGVGADPDGGGPVLPNLMIEIVSPVGLDVADARLLGVDDLPVQLVQ